MIQDTSRSAFTVESVAPQAMTAMSVALEPLGSVKSLVFSIALPTAFLLLMAVAVHVVMSLQKATTARSALWRALAAAGIVCACVVCGLTLPGMFAVRSVVASVFIFTSVTVITLAVTVRALYLTTVVRAVLSALVACAIVPALVMTLLLIVG